MSTSGCHSKTESPLGFQRLNQTDGECFQHFIHFHGPIRMNTSPHIRWNSVYRNITHIHKERKSQWWQKRKQGFWFWGMCLEVLNRPLPEGPQKCSGVKGENSKKSPRGQHQTWHSKCKTDLIDETQPEHPVRRLFLRVLKGKPNTDSPLCFSAGAMASSSRNVGEMRDRQLASWEAAFHLSWS